MGNGRVPFGAPAVLAMVLALGAGRALAAGGSLDGRTFVGESGEKGKDKGEREVIVFKDGTFRSTPCDVYGFGSAPYKATPVEGGTAFEAVTVSAKEGEMRWKATVRGDRLEGVFVWKKKGQADIEYWTRGTLKK